MIIKNDNVIILKDNKAKRMAKAMDGYLNVYVPFPRIYNIIVALPQKSKGASLISIPDTCDVLFLNKSINILVKLYHSFFINNLKNEVYVYIHKRKECLYPKLIIGVSGIYFSEEFLSIYQNNNGHSYWQVGFGIQKEKSIILKDFMSFFYS